MLCGLGAWGLAPPSQWAECLSAASCRPAVRVVGTVPAAAGAVSESWSCFRKALNTSVVGRGLFHVVTFEDSVLKILPPRAPVSEELCPVPRVTRIVGIFSAYKEGLSIFLAHFCLPLLVGCLSPLNG